MREPCDRIYAIASILNLDSTGCACLNFDKGIMADVDLFFLLLLALESIYVGLYLYKRSSSC